MAGFLLYLLFFGILYCNNYEISEIKNIKKAHTTSNTIKKNAHV